MLTEQQALQNLSKLINEYNELSNEERQQISEDGVIRQFVDRLLEEVLGWPIKDPRRYKYELHTPGGRPDITLFLENKDKVFIEAKKFGVIKELEEARRSVSGIVTPGQLALPGMAVDRTKEEQQAINYAFDNNGTWAILTNFEKLRLFNARRDWLVFSFERPSAYLDEFDMLWQLAYENVLKGSLDSLSNQRHTEEVDTDYLAFINEWRERLAQNIVEQREHNSWAFTDGAINLPLLRSVVQRYIDRLVIIRFAEDHFVLTPGTLRRFYDVKVDNIYADTMDSFLDTFFRRFDENHNSALFAKHVTDDAVFSDKVLLDLVKKLYEARYRAMPADILGNTYEQYLGKTLVLDGGAVKTRDNLETRKKQGTYYTPAVIVRHIVDHSLGRYLYGTQNGRPDGVPINGETHKTAADIRDLRVLDSACGSGSFLIYAYKVLADFYAAENERLEGESRARRAELAASGITRPLELEIQLTPYMAEMDRIADYPRIILETHLYGVDLDPQAAEIAVVNLMMRGMERRQQNKLLPLILNQNVKVGNSLVGLAPNDPRLEPHRQSIAHIRSLRTDLIRVPKGEEHERIIRDLADASAALNAELNAPFAAHFGDLERARPFHWAVEFPEVFFDAEGKPLENPGFTIIIGNPPWEILKPDLREFYAQFDERIESRLSREQAEVRIAELDAEDPNRRPAFEAQNRYVADTVGWIRQSKDYTRQGGGDPATHKLFLEHMVGLLQNGGRIGYVVPSGIYTDLGTKPLREMLLNEGNIQYIYSFSNERFFFPGVDHRFKFALLGAQKGQQTDGFWAAFRFNPRVAVAPNDLPAFLNDPNNLIYMRRDTVEKFSPESLSIMEFQRKQDYEVTERIYGQHPLIGSTVSDLWNVKLTAELHMTNDRDLFNTAGRGLPLYEGKMMHHFNAFFASPQFWVDELNTAARIDRKNERGKFYQNARIGIRAIASSTNERTLISTVLPPNVFCGNSIIVVREGEIDAQTKLFFVSALNSLVLDYVLRQKVTSNINMFYIYSLPLPRLTAGNPHFDAIVPRAARLTCTRSEFADLWQSVMGETWDATKGAADPAERARLRDEIDATVAQLYGLTRADFDHILGTFPLVFPDTDAGRARRAALLATYDTTP